MGKSFTEEERAYYLERIYEVGEQFFSKVGYKKTTISMLTAEIGIAKGSFYNFYASKEALFFRILLDKESERDRLFFDRLVYRSENEDFLEILIHLVSEEIGSMKNDAFMVHVMDQTLMKKIWHKLERSSQQESLEHDREKLKNQIEIASNYGYRFEGDLTVYTASLRTLVMALFDTIEDTELDQQVRTTLLSCFFQRFYKRKK